jgi:hypothetical protein
MDDLEARLRQFRPRRPKPLPAVVRSRRSRWPVWVAIPAAAAVAVILATVTRQESTVPVQTPSVAITLGALNAHGLESAENLDDILTRTSRAILPDVKHPGGVLEALSRE